MIRISGILLAAGESKRMGKPKLILNLGKSNIINATIDNLLKSEIYELIIVLGHEAQKIESSLSTQDKRIKFVTNKNYREGMSTSIKCGVLTTSKESEAFLIALGDQPLISPKVINRLIEKYQSSKVGIVTVMHKSLRGHPVLISKKYVKELLSLNGDIGARDLLKQHLDDTASIKIESSEEFFDIDRTQDYEELKKIYDRKISN
ncbi:nucleotidyltransferase family protein [Candidatus Bathyarchaeota archaeon]|nr:nucleotidyltransferase family protein [Candidatus Bathyarchaeota archaeon]